MMTQLGKQVAHTVTAGDRAVNGLLAGIGAGLLMLAFLLGGGLWAGEPVAATLVRFSAGIGAPSPVGGGLAHLAVSGIYGMVFGLTMGVLGRRLRAPLWALGIGYGLLLLLMAQGVVLPSAESPLLDIPLARWAIAHVIYGAALGVGLGRLNRGQ